MASRVHTGDSDVKIFVPEYRYEPSGCRSARVREPNITRSLPGSELPNAKISPAAASRRTNSTESSPRPTSSAASPVTTRCMFTASAVAGAAAASRTCSRATSSSVSPAPPSRSGTNAVRYPTPTRSARSSCGNVFSRSCTGARSWMRARTSSVSSVRRIRAMSALCHRLGQDDAMPTYAVRYTYDERTDVRDHFRAEHRSYLSALAEHGTLLGSGPFTDGDPGALLVFRAAVAGGRRRDPRRRPLRARGPRRGQRRPRVGRRARALERLRLSRSVRPS